MALSISYYCRPQPRYCHLRLWLLGRHDLLPNTVSGQEYAIDLHYPIRGAYSSNVLESQIGECGKFCIQ